MTRRQCIPVRLDQYVNHDARLIFEARLVFKARPLLAQLRQIPGLYSRSGLYFRPGLYSRKYGIYLPGWEIVTLAVLPFEVQCVAVLGGGYKSFYAPLLVRFCPHTKIPSATLDQMGSDSHGQGDD